MCSARSDELLHELGIGRIAIDGMDGLAGVIQNAHDSWWLAALDQLAHDLVVKELDVLPLHSLVVVLLLLATHRKIDKDLLQLFVDVVDTKLASAPQAPLVVSIN
jgi:hypothetical protein